MLIAEYDYDVDIAVQREEEREIALKEGIAQGEAKGFSLGVVQGEAKGFSIGIAQGKQEGISEGAYQKAIETAKLMRLHNYPVIEISTMTGLAKEEIESL